jgi:hypothetical protein
VSEEKIRIDGYLHCCYCSTVGHVLAQVAKLATLAGEGSMTTQFASNKFVPGNVASVPDGWAVVYIDPNSGDVREVVPMAGWATWTRSVIDDQTGNTAIEAGDPFVEAMVIADGWPVCAMELEGETISINGYVRPGEKPPTVGEFGPGLDPGQKGKGDRPFARGKGRQTPS